MKYFIDTNIIIDYFVGRKYPKLDLDRFFQEVHRSNIYISPLSIHIFFYVYRKTLTFNQKIEIINFVNKLNIIPLDKEVLNNTSLLDYNDYEDLLQYFSAIKECDVILTRNTSDFVNIRKLYEYKIEIIDKY